jgi:hypothetical protein
MLEAKSFTVRVRRAATEARTTTAVTGSQHVTRTVKLFASNMGAEPRAVVLVERIPVSEIDDVKVEVVSARGAEIDAHDGFARFRVKLGPRATAQVELSYAIEAGSRVVLPALGA